MSYEATLRYRFAAHPAFLRGRGECRRSEDLLRHISKQTRMDLIRAFNAELVYIRSPFPMGKTGLTLKQDGQGDAQR